MRRKLAYFASIIALAGCGVKGDPVPPGTPAEIGNGKPRFNDLKNPERRTPPLAIPKNLKDTENGD